MDLVLNRDLGTVTLENTNTQTILKLKKDESIMLLIVRLLYHEKLKETSINTNIIISINDLHAKYDLLEIREREHVKSINNTRTQLPNPEYGKKKKIHLISLSMKFCYKEGRGRTII